MLATTPDGFLLIDIDGKLWTPLCLCRKSGYSRDELLRLYKRYRSCGDPETTASAHPKGGTNRFARFETQTGETTAEILDVEITSHYAAHRAISYCLFVTSLKRKKLKKSLQPNGIDFSKSLNSFPLT
jgi:hypothetical protein